LELRRQRINDSSRLGPVSNACTEVVILDFSLDSGVRSLLGSHFIVPDSPVLDLNVRVLILTTVFLLS